MYMYKLFSHSNASSIQKHLLDITRSFSRESQLCKLTCDLRDLGTHMIALPSREHVTILS